MPHYSHSDLFLIFVFIVAIAAFVAYQAKLRGKNPWLWFVIGLLLSSLAPLLLLYFTTPTKNSQDVEGNGTMSVSLPDPALEKNPPAPFALPPLQVAQEEDKLWFYLDREHKQEGPVSVVALRELWNHAELDLNSYVWTKGMEQWQKIEQLADLRESLKS